MMMKRNLFLVLIACLFLSFVSSAFAASVLKRVSVNPFYRPPLTSEADLKELVKSQDTLIKKGFAKAGYPNLYRAFSKQFPSATIDSIKVSPGETFKWMFFRKKGAGPVLVTKDLTWGGAGPLDAYRFYIDMKGKRYEFAILHACGNFALKSIAKIPIAKTPTNSGKAATSAPAVKPYTSDKAATTPGAPMSATSGKAAPVAPTPMPGAAGMGTAGSTVPIPGTADSGMAGSTAPIPGSPADRAAASTTAPLPGTMAGGAAGSVTPMPGTADSGTAGSTAPMAGTAADRALAGTTAPLPGTMAGGAAGSMAPMPSTSESGAAAAAMTTSTAKFLSGTVVDTGFSHQADPASYLFVRMGYEFPLVDKFSLMAYLGGYFRIHGYDGGSAVVADAMLDYHWWNRLSFGMGAGYWWTGDDGQVDLIANVGVLVFGKPDSFNGTLFLEARSEIAELDNLHNLGRFGLGIRFRF
jgi:hypothetical protein